ncbi:MAG TPA: aldo/keto reductase [Hanamia sp.]|nr:aldo/keto reductase [Hanamia sp.]
MKLYPTYKANIYESKFPVYGSRLVYGTSGLGGIWGKVNEPESIDCILYALENGITSFDTAPSYNNAELYLGKALKQWKGKIPFVSTKVGRLRGDSAFDAKLDYSSQGMKESVLRSLDVLGLDKVNLLFLHEPQWVPLDKVEEILETFLSFKEQGFAEMLGIGGNPSVAFMPYVSNKYFDVISTFCMMDACNLSAFDGIIPVTLKENLSVYAASALHFSLLGNRFQQYTKEDPGITEISKIDIQNAIRVNKLANKYDLTLATLAQRYLFSIEEATRVVIGARKISQIQSTILDWKAGALPKKIFDEISGIIRGLNTNTDQQ